MFFESIKVSYEQDVFSDVNGDICGCHSFLEFRLTYAPHLYSSIWEPQLACPGEDQEIARVWWMKAHVVPSGECLEYTEATLARLLYMRQSTRTKSEYAFKC